MRQTERPAESSWLYNQPSPGIVENWWRRNEESIRLGWIDPWVLDGVVILEPLFREYDGTQDIRYTREQVRMVKTGPTVPPKNSELWDIYQAYTASEEGQQDFNGSKLHLHRYSPPMSDRNLFMEASDYDWHRMRVLGIGLRDGKTSFGGQDYLIDEGYRDDIMPSQTSQGFEFLSVHSNNIVTHNVVMTADNHLVLTTRSRSADYEAGNVSASLEEQMNGSDESPFVTFDRAVQNPEKVKTKTGEEMRLFMLPETARLSAIMLEPEVNGAALVIVGKCQEEAGQIDETRLGPDRAEFDYKKPVWTLPIEPSDQLIRQFWTPEGFRWHGSSRARIVAALSYVHGYEETIDRLYQGYLQKSQ